MSENDYCGQPIGMYDICCARHPCRDCRAEEQKAKESKGWADFWAAQSPVGRINYEGPELQNIKSLYQAVDWNGIKVLKDDMLTGRTMIVSPEVYEMLTETPEQRQAKARALVERADQFMALCDKLTKGAKS